MSSFNLLPNEVKLKIFTQHFEDVHIIAFCPCIKDHNLRPRSWMNTLLLSRSLKPLAEEAFFKAATFIQAYSEPWCWCDPAPAQKFRHINGTQSLVRQLNNTLDQPHPIFANLESATVHFRINYDYWFPGAHPEGSSVPHEESTLSDLETLRVICARKGIKLTSDVEFQQLIDFSAGVYSNWLDGFLSRPPPPPPSQATPIHPQQKIKIRFTETDCPELLITHPYVRGLGGLNCLVKQIFRYDLSMPEDAPNMPEGKSLLVKYCGEGTTERRILRWR